MYPFKKVKIILYIGYVILYEGMVMVLLKKSLSSHSHMNSSHLLSCESNDGNIQQYLVADVEKSRRVSVGIDHWSLQ